MTMKCYGGGRRRRDDCCIPTLLRMASVMLEVIPVLWMTVLRSKQTPVWWLIESGSIVVKLRFVTSLAVIIRMNEHCYIACDVKRVIPMCWDRCFSAKPHYRFSSLL